MILSTMTSLHSGLLLGQIDWQPLYEDHGIPLALMGLFVVFVALTLLRVFIGTLPKIIAILDHFHPVPEAAAPVAAAAAPTDEIPEEILAVIAAAVAATVHKPHRILRTSEVKDQAWALEGRLQHHASHRIQPRNPK